jgi:hypothetical protein
MLPASGFECALRPARWFCRFSLANGSAARRAGIYNPDPSAYSIAVFVFGRVTLMPTALSTPRSDLLERVVKLAWQEADILVWIAQRRRGRRANGNALGNGDSLTPAYFAQRAQEMAEALICNAGGPRVAGSASRIWSRVRAILMDYTVGWTVEEFIIHHVTRNQYEGFPYGLAASDLVRLAEGEFSASRIRSTMTRLARKNLIKKCHTKRRKRRPDNPIPLAEYVWFYSGPSSKYAESPEAIYYMHTPWDQRPHGPASAA